MGGYAIHLNILVGFQLSKKIRNKAALACISSKLAFWGGVKIFPKQADCSLPTKSYLFAFGTWPLVPIYHMPSSPSLGPWNRTSYGLDGIKTCTKVAWDFTIQPHALGGVKLLELMIQASSFLTKLLIHGLQLGFKSWKIFFLHCMNTIRLVCYGTWLPSAT